MRIRRNVFAGAAIVLAAWLVACAAPGEVPRVTDVAIVGGDRALQVGASLSLTADVATVAGADVDVAWSSDLPEVAEVDAAGVVTGRSVGTARITATSVFTPSVADAIAVTIVAASPDPPGAPASLVVVAGDEQTWVVGQAVPVRPAVRVLDADGRPVPEVDVAFTSSASGSSVTPAQVTSDADGIATLISWNLGVEPGVQTLRARVDGATPPIEVTFTATATVGLPSATKSMLAADPLQLPADGIATSALVVRLHDMYGNPLDTGGASVTFDPPAVGTIGPVVDGGDGSYATTYTAGTTTGSVEVTARLDGAIVGDPVTLELVAVPEDDLPGPPTSLIVVAGDGQTTGVGEAVPVPPAVRVQDADGGPVPDVDVAVAFGPVAGGGSVTPGTPVTSDADGVATLVSWNLGTTPGANALRASVDGATPPIEATLTATAVVGPAFADASTLTADPLRLPADGAATCALTVRLRDRYGNPLDVGGATVTFDAPTVGAIGAVVDGGDGGYAATYTAGTTAGSVEVTARLDGAVVGDPVTLELEAVSDDDDDEEDDDARPPGPTAARAAPAASAAPAAPAAAG